MNRNMIKTMCTLSVAMLMVLGSANAAILFQDTFDGTGALGDGWDSWTNTSSGAVHGQSGGSYVFDHTSTNWAQAAVQSDPVYITAYDAVDFKFHIKDFGGSDSNSVDGATSFIVAEGEEPALDDLLGNTTYPLDGLVLKIPHNTINFGSYPDAASDPRTWVEIWNSDYSTLFGKIVVQSTNDFTLVVSLNYDAWSVDVEGASFWVAEGWSHGLHGYDLWSWATGARLRMESWNVDGDFGSASIDDVTIEATPKTIPFLFDDTFDGTGALGADWVSWQEAASGANPGQTNGCYVFDNIGTSWAQAAVQTTTTVDIASTVNATARFHVKDYSGSTAWDGMAAGITSFIFAEYDPVLDSLYDTSGIDGIVLSVEHQAINGGSWPDAASDPRTWVQIKKTDDTVLGVVVVQSTNDYTMALIMTTNTWEFGVEGATYWIDSGTTSGLHGYDLSTWAGGACLRMESWNADGDWRPSRINSAAIEVPPPYYEKWALDNFLLGTNALRTADVDIDGMGNLLEYAIGGNPRVYDTVVLPTASVVEDTGTNWLEFVYNRRFDHVARDLDYGVILSDNLVAGVWTNIGMSAETGSGMINAAMESVTNRISTVDDVKFSRLEVTEN